jgi:anti-anti-sigma factor
VGGAGARGAALAGVSLLLLYRASRPHVGVLGQVPGADGHYGDILRHPENRQVPGIVVLRLESGLFFANADAVRDAIRVHAAEPGIRAVVLDAETIPFLDVTAARILLQLGADLDRQGVRLVMARDIGQVRDVLRRTEGERLPLSAFQTVREAMAALTRRP